MTRECKQQFTLRISQANATELVVILYEMLILYLQEAKEALEKQDKTAFSEAIRKSRGCIKELMHSLHMEYEPAPTLLQLYLFCIRSLAKSEFHKEEQPLLEVERVIIPLKEAYEKIAKQNTDGPVMQNYQTVYAGLTYGRNQLTENMTDQGTNRGMLA